MASERQGKRELIVNPDEPRTGDFAFDFYDASHPVFGRPGVVSRLKGELRGLRGEDLKVTVRGRRVDADTGQERRFQVIRTVHYRNYNDLFGPGSVYGSAIKAVRDRHSDEQLITDSITIEAA